MDKLLKTLLATTDELKASLEDLQPFPLSAAAALRESLVLDFISHSSALDGGSLSLLETKVAVKGTAVPHRSLLGHFRVLNQYSAVRYVENLAMQNQDLTERDISQLNHLVHRRLYDKGGEYVLDNVSSAIYGLLDWRSGERSTHPIIRAVQLHNEFLKIYPFFGGNESTARLLIAYELLEAGYPLATIRKEQKWEYDAAINASRIGDDTNMILLVAKSVQHALKRSLALMMPDSNERRRR